jgi:hypothetical protein
VQHPASPAVARPSCQTLGLLRVINELVFSWPCTRLAGAECRGPCHGAFVSGQGRRLFGCIVVFRRKQHGAEAPKKSKAIDVSSGKYGPNTKQRHNASINQLEVSNRMQSRAIESLFRNPVSMSPSARNVVTDRHASRGCMRASEPSPNPSIEGTCNIWLRQLSPAPHVKR